MFDLVFLTVQLAGNNKGNPALQGLFVAAVLTVIIISNIRNEKKKKVEGHWENGIFPKHLEGTRDNLLEAYICLGALMIRADRRDMRDKIMYMNKYFNQYFPKSIYNFSDSLSHSLRYPVQHSSVASWMQLKFNKHQRLQVMYFLAGLSAIDGSIGTREMKILEELRDYLRITPKEYESVIAMYTQRQSRQRTTSSGSSTSSPSKKSAIQLAATVLGVSEHASMDEIKKAYRQLVKIHHPDRFEIESEEQKKLAEERFIEIQKAYEIMEKYK